MPIDAKSLKVGSLLTSIWSGDSFKITSIIKEKQNKKEVITGFKVTGKNNENFTILVSELYNYQ